MPSRLVENNKGTYNPMALAYSLIPSSVRTSGELSPDTMTFNACSPVYHSMRRHGSNAHIEWFPVTISSYTTDTTIINVLGMNECMEEVPLLSMDPPASVGI